MKRWPQSAAIGVALLAAFCVAKAANDSRSESIATLADSKAAVPSLTRSDIAPILFRSCAPCHRPGEAAPFSLLTLRGCEIARAID